MSRHKPVSRYQCLRMALILFGGLLVAAGARAEGFRIYQLQVFCTKSQVATVIFGYVAPPPSVGTKVICVGHCPGGRVAMKDALAALPPEASKGLQEQLDKHEENAAAGEGKSLAGCECDKEKIEGLKGRIRGLREAADAHRKDFNQKTDERAKARDRLWGKGEGLRFESGSIAEFGKSVRDSLMIAGGDTGVGKIVKKAETAQGWVETAVSIGSSPASLEAWGEYGEKVLGKKAEEVFKQRSAEAMRAAREHFNRTGNYAGAQRVYKENWGSYGKLKDFQKAGEGFANFLDALSTLAELAKNTDAVTKDLSDWTGAYKEANALQAELDKIDRDMQRVLDEIARLQADCGDEAQGAHALVFARFSGAASESADAIATDATYTDAIYTDGTADDAYFLDVAQQTAAADQAKVAIQRAELALRKLAQLRAKIQDVDRRLGADIVAPLSPWFGNSWRDAPPRDLLVNLAKSAGPGLRRFVDVVKAMTPVGVQADSALRSIPPDPVK